MEGELQRRLGVNLRVRRTRLAMSQEEFAELLGVHRTYYGGIERAERNLTLRSVERIAQILEVDAHELLRPASRRAAR